MIGARQFGGWTYEPVTQVLHHPRLHLVIPLCDLGMGCAAHCEAVTKMPAATREDALELADAWYALVKRGLADAPS